MTESILVAPSAAESPRANLPEYTVSELSAAVKRSLEQGFSYVRVRGEVSGFKRHGSGHCYLSLKDSEAVLDAVIWRATAQRASSLAACTIQAETETPAALAADSIRARSAGVMLIDIRSCGLLMPVSYACGA